MTHPDINQPGAGGHEVKPGSAEAKGISEGESNASAAENSRDNNPRRDNTAEQALEGGSTETMDRSKRQANADVTGARTGHDSVQDSQTRGGLQQESTRGSGYDNSSSLRGPGQESNYTRDQERGSLGSGSGLAGSTTGHHSSTTGHHTGHHGSNTGLTGGLTGSQSGTEPISGVRGSGVAGEPYDAGNVQSTGLAGSDPQTRHQTHHGIPHHGHDFSGQHTTRTGELLDPASGRDTGIPGYTGIGSSTGSGLTGSSTGSGLTGSTTGHHTTSHTGTGEGILREGERAVGRDTYGSNTSGLTGSHGTSGLTGSHGTSGVTGSQGTSGLTGSHTGTGYGQSTGERLREDVREGERAVGTGATGSGVGSGVTGSHTGTGHHSSTTGTTGTTGDRLREDVREGEERATGRDTTGSHTTGSNTTDTTKQSKPSLMDRLNPLKDSDHDGKKGFMD